MSYVPYFWLNRCWLFAVESCYLTGLRGQAATDFLAEWDNDHRRQRRTWMRPQSPFSLGGCCDSCYRPVTCRCAHCCSCRWLCIECDPAQRMSFECCRRPLACQLACWSGIGASLCYGPIVAVAAVNDACKWLCSIFTTALCFWTYDYCCYHTRCCGRGCCSQRMSYYCDQQHDYWSCTTGVEWCCQAPLVPEHLSPSLVRPIRYRPELTLDPNTFTPLERLVLERTDRFDCNVCRLCYYFTCLGFCKCIAKRRADERATRFQRLVQDKQSMARWVQTEHDGTEHTGWTPLELLAFYGVTPRESSSAVDQLAAERVRQFSVDHDNCFYHVNLVEKCCLYLEVLFSTPNLGASMDWLHQMIQNGANPRRRFKIVYTGDDAQLHPVFGTTLDLAVFGQQFDIVDQLVYRYGVELEPNGDAVDRWPKWYEAARPTVLTALQHREHYFTEVLICAGVTVEDVLNIIHDYWRFDSFDSFKNNVATKTHMER